MEALAALQLQRRQTKRETLEREALQVVAAPQTMKDRNSLNRILGFADPPEHVYALAKDESAAVWWTESGEGGADESIVSWQVQRFRRDKSRPTEDIWHAKGVNTYDAMPKNQVLVYGLSNDQEYRFTVAAVNIKGPGGMSDASNGVMVEKALPNGWYRFFNTTLNRHYYANVRLNLSSWERPELDSWFLDEALQLNFSRQELESLRGLYKEEIAHFDCVTVEQFIDVMRECGESASKGWITKLFRGYGGSELQVRQWKHFMEVVNHIKKSKQQGVLKVTNPVEKLLNFLSRMRISALLRPADKGKGKLGDWTVEYSALAEKSYYLNRKTGESFWSMPPQVMFYIPPKLEDKLLQVFDFGDLEEFQQYFSVLDIDNSGDLSPKEIRLLLKTLHLEISESKFNKLIRTVDLNGNGTIEFDEYCWMMLQIFQKDKGGKAGGIFGELKQTDKGGQLERQDSLDNSVDSVGGFADAAAFSKSGLDLSYKGMRDGLSGMKAQANGGEDQPWSWNRRLSRRSSTPIARTNTVKRSWLCCCRPGAGRGGGVHSLQAELASQPGGPGRRRQSGQRTRRRRRRQEGEQESYPFRRFRGGQQHNRL